MTSHPRGTLIALNVARAQAVLIQGRSVLTAYRKTSTTERIPIGPLGLSGDEQADLTVHGGPDKAVYAYPVEHYPFWQAQRRERGLDDALPHGMLGENLTLQGFLDSDAWIGDELHFPACTLIVREPRYPCFKFTAVMGFKQAARLMAQSGHCGYYLSVRSAGHICAGESFELIPGPREVAISSLFKATMRKG